MTALAMPWLQKMSDAASELPRQWHPETKPKVEAYASGCKSFRPTPPVLFLSIAAQSSFCPLVSLGLSSRPIVHQIVLHLSAYRGVVWYFVRPSVFFGVPSGAGHLWSAVDLRSPVRLSVNFSL